MAHPASKRRKTNHISSDEDEDASFASDNLNSDTGAEDLDREQSELEDDERDSAEERSNAHGDSRNRPSGSHGKLESLPTSTSNTSTKPDRKSTTNLATSANGSAYSAGNFKNNVFKLQIDDLLKQIRPKHTRREAEAEEALHRLKSEIDDIPACAALSVDEAERKLLRQKVVVPFPDPRPPKDAKYKLEYAKPENINVVGSHVHKTSLRSRDTLEIDMAVTMPRSIFQEKDYLNYRYFYKRAYYLAWIAAGLAKACRGSFKMRYTNWDDNPLKPILVVEPVEASNLEKPEKPLRKWKINILPCVSESIFPEAKLGLQKNCLRKTIDSESSMDAKNDDSLPTSFYNSSIRSDMLMKSYLKALNVSSKSCVAFQDACLLGSTWLRQRGIASSINAGGFGSFEWSALMAALLHGDGRGGKSVLSDRYNSYQLFKAMLQVLAIKDLSKNPFVINSENKGIKTLDDGTPIVWDAVNAHNPMYKMTSWSYNILRREAKTTIAMLSDVFDNFDATFILRTSNPLYRFDYFLEVEQSRLRNATPTTNHQTLTPQHTLYTVLSRALGDRVSLIHLSPASLGLWAIDSAIPRNEGGMIFKVGFAVNPETESHSVDHGPPAEDKTKSASFRTFWGEKAELRRFKDGSITEALVWNTKDAEQSIIEQICRYILARHLGLGAAEDSLKFTGNRLKRSLPRNTSQSAFEPFMEAYKQLENDIRSLQELPLSVRQIMPADAQLRFSSVDIPLTKQKAVPADVVVQFEGSASWPDDLVAIQRTKIAFLIKLGELLRSSDDTITARIGLENEEYDTFNQAFLDIVYVSGAAFRLRIHHEREQTLLERQLKNKTIDPRAKEAAVIGLAKYKRDYLKAPAHTQAIARLCRQYPALSGTIRLMKKWVASHLLANHVADEVTELISARTFVNPWPWEAPSSIQTGFLRTLFWVSRWDWRVRPLIVDLSGSADLKQEHIQSISTKFEAWRKVDPALNRVVFFTATNVDPDGTTWSDGRPAKVVAGRITALARAAVAEIEKTAATFDPISLFASSLVDFDFVLHLDPAVMSGRRLQNGSAGTIFKNLALSHLDDVTSIGFAPISDFLQELDKVYGSAIYFFSGGLEKPIIAGLWNPQTAPRAWKLNNAFSTIPRKESDKDEIQGQVNKKAILNEIARMGEGMIKRVEVNDASA